MKRTISWIILTCLLASAFFLAFQVKPAQATAVTVYINFDGSVSPSSAPISSPDNITYTFTGNISYPTYNGIVVARSNIVINGNGYTVQGNQTSPSGNGLDLTDLSNVTIKNVNIRYFQNGIYLLNSKNTQVSWNNATNDNEGIVLDSSSSNDVVSGNRATANYGYGISVYSSSSNTVSGNTATTNYYCGIYLSSSTNNTVSGNNATTYNTYGIWLDSSSNNTVSGNNATVNYYYGIYLIGSSNNTVSGNNATANSNDGIYLIGSSNNTVSGNNAAANIYGIWLDSSSNNTLYHNNFMNNIGQVGSVDSTNAWDNDYPSGGNYWSDYFGVDVMRGLYQNITGSDGIGDTPYVPVGNDTDRYPLMGPFGSSMSAGSNVTVFPSENLGLIFSNVVVAGSIILKIASAQPPINLTGDYYYIRVTANTTGNITIRIIYNDSNMTLQQENNLQMVQCTPVTGDITGSTPAVPDGKVDIRDISYIAKRFGTNSASPNWDPIADITGPIPMVPDGKVDIRDISIAAKHFGENADWTNITTSVDTANNVIYGITTHFSVIGIHQQ